MNVLAICGSLRRASYNRHLLVAAQRLAPTDMTIELYDDLREIPPYDQDLDRDQPAPVQELRRRWEAADGVVIALPEYSYGPPGVVKNAIDWLSRPPGTLTLRHKPVGIIGASTGLFGTTRAQLAMRQTFIATNSDVLIKPEVYVMKAAEKFDANGELIDADSVTMLGQFLEAFCDHVRAGQHAPRQAVARSSTVA